MKNYEKPIIEDEKLELEDVVLASDSNDIDSLDGLFD